MKKSLLIVPALGVLILLGGCSYYQNQTQTQPSQTKTSATPATANSVTIQGFAFSPAELKVKAGTTVTWINNDSVPHTIKSTTFNSATLARGEKFEFKFEKTGTFDYACGIHPSMQGKIVVE